MNIQLKSLTVNFDQRFWLRDINWQIQSGQHWLLVGNNGAGKSALAAVLCGEGQVESGSIDGLPDRVGWISSHAQAELLAEELKKDDADILDVIAEGTPAGEILQRDCTDHALKEQLVDTLGFRPLMQRAYRKLSSGETRKLLIIRALASEPQLLILDEPYAGLDQNSCTVLSQYLAELAATLPMVWVLNRQSEWPAFITHIAYLHNVDLNKGELTLTIENTPAQRKELEQLLTLENQPPHIPPTDPNHLLPPLDADKPLVRLRDITIRYEEATILSGLDWTIEPGQHWQLSGANGSGKTSLLALITGDHPQCYSNDIFVFGFQRGNGESIWQVKQYIGYVSSALHWDYRVATSARNVIISGFYDSIGVYQHSSKSEQGIADQWLEVLGLATQGNTPFNQLSFGEQRMLLIARAMVKHPPLLILDEPCLGLDVVNRQKVLTLIEMLCKNSDSTVLYVSHSKEDHIAGIQHQLHLDTNQST